jgi:hypothetical protein
MTLSNKADSECLKWDADDRQRKIDAIVVDWEDPINKKVEKVRLDTLSDLKLFQLNN